MLLSVVAVDKSREFHFESYHESCYKHQNSPEQTNHKYKFKGSRTRLAASISINCTIFLSEKKKKIIKVSNPSSNGKSCVSWKSTRKQRKINLIYVVLAREEHKKSEKERERDSWVGTWTWKNVIYARMEYSSLLE
jgi:hypothetical protein